MVIEFFWLALHGFIVYGLFQMFVAWYTQKEVTNLNNALDEFNENIIICRVEEQDGMFYFWNVLDDTFVGQARTVPEIADISERLQKQLLMEEGDKDLLEKLQKMVREVYEVRSESTIS
jgi:hypothetical protein